MERRTAMDLPYNCGLNLTFVKDSAQEGRKRSRMVAAQQPLLLYKSPKTEAASRGAGQLIAKVVQWKGNGLTDHPKSFALATESVSQPSIVQRSICAGRVPSGTLESANR